MEFGIEKYAMLIMKRRKRETVEEIELPKSGTYMNTCGDKKLQILGNIGSEHHPTSEDEGKNKKRLPQANKKTSQNLAQQQNSHQSDKCLGSPPYKILRTILKIDKGVT